MASISSSPGKTKFGEDPAAYDLARPAYPPHLFDWLRERCALGPHSGCIEVGAGTGLATLPVLAMPVRAILAIEPDAALAAALRAKSGDPRLSIIVKRFEDVELPPAQDLAFAATSFHWLPRTKSLARVFGALKPGGWFAMWWSVFHDPAKPDAFDQATAHLFNGLEQDRQATSNRPAFALDVNSRTGEMRAAGFVDVERRLFAQTIEFSPQRLSALYATFSRVRMAPQETRSRLLAEVERIASEDFGGSVEREIVTSAFAGRRPL